MSAIISEGEVALRPVEESDLGLIMRWRNSPEVSAYLFSTAAYTMEGQRKWFARLRESGDIYAIAEYQGTPFGLGRIVNIDAAHRKCEIGGEIGDLSFRGKGLGKKLFYLLTKHCFRSLGMNRVYLKVFASNAVAIHIYESLGYQHEGVLRQDVLKEGAFRDVLVMGVLRDEWK